MFPIKKAVTGSIDVAGQQFLSLRNALAQSNNEVSIQVFARSGPQEVVKWAHALGVHSRLEPDMSLALGSYEVTPLEMANAFATFASGGIAAEPVMVTRIEQQGTATPLPATTTTQPMTPEEAYMTTSLLRGVIEYGTGAAARRLGRELAGKTGTTNESKDTWFIGYSTDIVTAVWVGYDDARPLGKQESGAKTALPAWIAFMEAAHKNRPKTVFARPSGTLVLNVDPNTGLLPRPGQAETKSEEFLPGTEPNVVAPEVPSTLPAASDAPFDPSLPADSAFPADPAAPIEAVPPVPQQPAGTVGPGEVSAPGVIKGKPGPVAPAP
jgi:penicillin-binding protein 1A